MSLPQFLADYGYLAVFIGCLLEGETLLVLAGFAAQQGLLSLPLVMGLAFVAGTLGDQIFFFIGNRYGVSLLHRFPKFETASQRVKKLLVTHHTWLIVGVRFMYGLRIAGPIAIGMSEVPPRRFLLLNMLGAAIWAVLVAGVGFVFGRSLQWLIADLGKYEEVALVVVVCVALLIGLLHRLHARRSAAKSDALSAAQDAN
jgi:membrane protein DedA with SNARE-associated domain